jgi:S1-C subfamily serine protease
MNMMKLPFRLPLSVGGMFLITVSAVAQPAADSPRMTPLVKVIQKAEPAVVALYVYDAETKNYGGGSGAIVHSSGYIVTNDHVVTKDDGYALVSGKIARFRVVGRSPEKDIAIVKLTGVRGRMPTVPLGHSHDVMNGESVVVLGNPGGRGIVATAGIISAKSILMGSLSALVMSQYDTSYRDKYLQFDAASNRGNSGGPVINMDGRLIGMVWGGNAGEQGVGYAIPVDRIRNLMLRIVEPELNHEKFVGMELNPLADLAIVSEVVPGSPAASAGLSPGDVIESVDGDPMRHAIDWILTLDKKLQSDDPIPLVARRGAVTLPVSIRPQPLAATAGVDVDAEMLQPGLEYEFFHGEYKLIPDFSQLKPERSGTIETFDLDAMRGERSDQFGLVIAGFLKVETPGLYRVKLTSDDGSRLILHGNEFINHDGNHPPSTISRLWRAAAGYHPIRVEYFETAGEQALNLEAEFVGELPEGETANPTSFVRQVDDATDEPHEESEAEVLTP